MSLPPRRDLRFAALFLGLGLAWVAVAGASRPADRREARALVAAQGLTDLCLATEARYTRHPAMADRHGAFQDHPGAREHFPTGSLILPRVHGRP